MAGEFIQKHAYKFMFQYSLSFVLKRKFQKHFSKLYPNPKRNREKGYSLLGTTKNCSQINKNFLIQLKTIHF